MVRLGWLERDMRGDRSEISTAAPKITTTMKASKAMKEIRIRSCGVIGPPLWPQNRGLTSGKHPIPCCLMPVLPNEKHEAFAQALAQDDERGTAARRYKEIFGTKSPNIDSSASKLRARVRPRIDEIRQGFVQGQSPQELKTAQVIAQKAEEIGAIYAGRHLTMAERREFLARVVRADVTRLDTEKDGDLVQEIVINEQGTKLKLPGKRECILLDAQLAGEMVEKVDMSLKDKRVLLPDERARLLRESIARRNPAHGRS